MWLQKDAMTEHTPVIYIRVQEASGAWVTIDARDATEAQFRDWLLRLLHRAGWVVALRPEGLDG